MNTQHPHKKPSLKKGRSSADRRNGRPRKSVHEKSCGVILYRVEEEQREYLLLHYPGGHWDFPKGHVEEKDSDEHATALRELQEETGISEVIFTNGYREPMYYEFNRGHYERVKKVVIYFLGQTEQMEVDLSFEHKNFQWLVYGEALQTLTYENAKDLLRKAEQHLSKRHEETQF